MRHIPFSPVVVDGVASCRVPSRWVAENTIRGIYGLRDPLTGVIRYVGQAEHIGKRFKQHMRPGGAAATSGVVARGRWVLGLQQRGLAPEIVLLEDIPFGDMTEAEGRWIDAARIAGGADLNIRQERVA